MQVFDGGQAGGDRAGADALAVLIDGQGLRRLVDHDAVHIAGLDGAQFVGADITADERAVFIAVGFYDGPAVIQILDQVQALAQAGHRTDLLAVVGGVVDVGGFGFADVHADHRAGERRPDVRVARVGRQPPVARVRLIDGIAHAHADFIALLAERGFARSDIFHHLLRFARGRRFGGRGGRAGRRRGRGILRRGSVALRRGGVFFLLVIRLLRERDTDDQLAADAAGGLAELVDQLAADGISARTERRTAVIRHDKVKHIAGSVYFLAIKKGNRAGRPV